MTFEEYLTKRRVNVAAFAAAEPQRFAAWQDWFGQMHPESFYVMVKMVLNDVRRNYWLAEVPKPIAVAETAEAAKTAAPARPAGRRAAIPRPAGANPAIPPAPITSEAANKPTSETQETKSTELTTPPTSAESVTAKPARPVFKPRGVIKKPTEPSAGDPIAENVNSTPKLAKPETEPEPEKENSLPENQETATPKLARPRAVIKRPAALAKPESASEDLAAKNSETPAPEQTKTVGNSPEKVFAATSAAPNPETPKPSRPRPVFKRPAAADSAEKPAQDSEKTVGETDQKPEAISGNLTESPVAKPGQEGASEAKTVSEEIQHSPEAAKAAEEVAAAAGSVPKPARPRPVFKRPTTTPPETPAIEPAKTVPETAPKPEDKATNEQPEKPAETAENLAEKIEEPTPKPPRPRPIFKRPAKPENDNEANN